MSAAETPLVTPDALNKILTAENADLRMREHVGKEAFDKMRADLAARDALIRELREKLEWLVADTEFSVDWPTLLARTPDDADAELIELRERVKGAVVGAQDARTQIASMEREAMKRDEELERLRERLRAYETPEETEPILKLTRENAALRAQLAEVARKVGSMSVLEGEERENGGTLAMLDEIAARSTQRMERAEAAEARVRDLEAKYHEASLGKDGAAVIDAWWHRGAGIKDPSLGDLQTQLQLYIEARLAAVLGAADAMRDELDSFARGFDIPDKDALNIIAHYDAARTGDAAHPDTARAERLAEALRRMVSANGGVAVMPTLEAREQNAALAQARAALAGEPDAKVHPDSVRLAAVTKEFRDFLTWLLKRYDKAYADGTIGWDDAEERRRINELLENLDAAKAGAGVDASDITVGETISGKVRIELEGVGGITIDRDWAIRLLRSIACIAGGGDDIPALLEDKAIVDWIAKHWNSQHTGQQYLLRGRALDNPTGSFRDAVNAARKEGSK